MGIAAGFDKNALLDTWLKSGLGFVGPVVVEQIWEHAIRSGDPTVFAVHGQQITCLIFIYRILIFAAKCLWKRSEVMTNQY